jgi:phosphopantetheinyl transferase
LILFVHNLVYYYRIGQKSPQSGEFAFLRGDVFMSVIYGVAAPGRMAKDLAPALLEFGLHAVWGLTELPPIRQGRWGKPYFPDFPAYHFNLSHTQGLCLCALSGAPVGVDVERVRPRRALLPQYVMTPEELSGFDGTWEDFYRIWTLKEAWCKYQGISLWPPRAAPAIPPCPHRSYAGPGWRAALCAQDSLPQDVCMLALSDLGVSDWNSSQAQAKAAGIFKIARQI